MTLVAQHLIKPIGKGYFVATLVCQYGTHVTHEVTQTYKRSVNNMWIIISIVLALTCMWLIKVNKDLVDRNNELITRNIMKSLTEREDEIPTKPVTDKQKELLRKHYGNDKEDNE